MCDNLHNDHAYFSKNSSRKEQDPPRPGMDQIRLAAGYLHIWMTLGASSSSRSLLAHARQLKQLFIGYLQPTRVHEATTGTVLAFIISLISISG